MRVVGRGCCLLCDRDVPCGLVRGGWGVPPWTYSSCNTRVHSNMYSKSSDG
eukprot:SAG25_NODE_175_length_12811_cov_5.011721_12_plen_51_part_00